MNALTLQAHPCGADVLGAAYLLQLETVVGQERRRQVLLAPRRRDHSGVTGMPRHHDINQ